MKNKDGTNNHIIFIEHGEILEKHTFQIQFCGDWRTYQKAISAIDKITDHWGACELSKQKGDERIVI